MDVKSAVKIAKEYITELLKDEGMSDLGLEAVEYDEGHDLWRVTLGFSRPWNSIKGPLANIAGNPPAKRAYRVIEIRGGTGQVVAMKRDQLVG